MVDKEHEKEKVKKASPKTTTSSVKLKAKHNSGQKKKKKSARSKSVDVAKSSEITTDTASVAVKKSRARTTVKKSKSADAETVGKVASIADKKIKSKSNERQKQRHQSPHSAPVQAVVTKQVKSAVKISESKSAPKTEHATLMPVAKVSAVKSGGRQPSPLAATAPRVSAKVARATAPISSTNKSTSEKSASAVTGRQRTPGKHRQHGTGSTTVRTGHAQQASSGNVDTASSSARNRSNLLTARSHRSSLSSYGHGESTVSPYGDVRTMVCDVSPVPSDVESIDFSSNTTGRSQALRVSREGDSTPFSTIAKKQSYMDDSPRGSRKSGTKMLSKAETEESNEHRHRSDELLQKTSPRNEVLVRIVPDSAKCKSVKPTLNQKSDSDRNVSKAGNAQSLKPDNAKGKPGTVRASSKPNVAIAPTTLKQSQAGNKFVRNTTVIKNTLAICTAGTNQNGYQQAQSDNASINNSNILLPKDDTDQTDNLQESNEPTETNTGTSKMVQDSIWENTKTTTRIPADEECCKAYTVLQNRGFKISLHTIRKALLTPSEYRMLRASLLPSH